MVRQLISFSTAQTTLVKAPSLALLAWGDLLRCLGVTRCRFSTRMNYLRTKVYIILRTFKIPGTLSKHATRLTTRVLSTTLWLTTAVNSATESVKSWVVRRKFVKRAKVITVYRIVANIVRKAINCNV